MELIKYLGKGTGLAFLLSAMVIIFGIAAFIIIRSSKKEYAGRILFPLFFIEAGFVFLVILLGFPAKKEAGVGPGVVPLLWIIGIFSFSILLLVKALLKFEEKDPKWGRIDVVFIYLGFTILYLILMRYIGYYIATILYLVGGMYSLSYRNWKVILSLTAGWLLFSYFAFYKLLYVPLPTGKLITWIFG